MLDRVLALLSGRPSESAADELQVAVAALLVEAARMDDRFDEAERAVIRRILAERFGLDEAAVSRLLAEAESAEARAAGVFRFTRQVVRSLGPAERIGLIEMMWRVAFADGVLDPEEDALLRRVAGLIHVEDRERGAARQRAIARLAAEGSGRPGFCRP